MIYLDPLTGGTVLTTHQAGHAIHRPTYGARWPQYVGGDALAYPGAGADGVFGVAGNQIMFTVEVERRLVDLRPHEGCQDARDRFDVAVPVDTAAETAGGELAHVELEIFLGQPFG